MKNNLIASRELVENLAELGKKFRRTMYIGEGRQLRATKKEGMSYELKRSDNTHEILSSPCLVTSDQQPSRRYNAT